ncbi:MAG: hypothetical protein HY243_01350 [Proteobacteria bacterium]|nr:hypothetical protein [Pseudomonadota bacterium]
MSDARQSTVHIPRALEDAIPIRLWIAIGSLCLLSLVVGFGTIEWAQAVWLEGVDAHIAQQSRLVEAMSPPERRQGPLVIFVGSSRIHHAMADPMSFGKEIGANAKVLLFHLDNARSSWVDKIMPIAERAHPDLLLVQYEILEPPQGEPNFGFFRSITMIVNALRNGIDSGAPKSVARQCVSLKKSFGEAVTEYNGISIAATPTLAAMPVLERLRRTGVRVAILDLPRAMELESAQPLLVRWRTQTLSALAARGFAVWRFAGEWKSDNFCDFAHLNERGRARFDPWLAAKIRHELDLSP